MADNHANFADSTVSVPPSPALSGTTVTVSAGQGALFPTAPFNVLIWPATGAPVSTNAEIARCTNRSGDVLTIIRNAETGGTNRAIVSGDRIADTITKKALTDAELFFNVASYQPTGDGVTDDSTILQAVITACSSTKRLVLERGKTYCVNTPLTISTSLRLDGNGATIIKSTTLNDYALKVTGPDVFISDLNVNGNRTGGNANAKGCINWTGLRGTAKSVKTTNSKVVGWFVNGTGVEVDAYECEASDILTSATTGCGFEVGLGAILRTYTCRADDNGRSGFLVDTNAAAGCHIDGTANNNHRSGLEINAPAGTVGRFYSSNNRLYGVEGAGSATTSGWTFDHVQDDDCGRALNGEYTPNPSATGIELFGVTGYHFATVVIRRPYGYGVALVKDTGTGIGSTKNTFGHIYVQSAGDPAFHLSGSSSENTIGSLIVQNATMAVSFGEGVAGANNDYNRFNFIHAVECYYAVIRGDVGSHNTFGRVVAMDCVCHTPYTTLVEWDGANSSYNAIHYWESENPAAVAVGFTMPANIMKCDATATHNWIADGFARDYGGTPLNDLGGSSRVDFATPP